MNTIILQVQTASPVHQAAEEFVKLDPWGIGMAVIAMTIVFAVLAIIFIIYKNIAKLIAIKSKPKTVNLSVSNEIAKTDTGDIPAEVGAAISLAMHLYATSQHDLDSLTLTIQKVSRMYSPWSSKIYTLRQLPR